MRQESSGEQPGAAAALFHQQGWNSLPGEEGKLRAAAAAAWGLWRRSWRVSEAHQAEGNAYSHFKIYFLKIIYYLIITLLFLINYFIINLFIFK